MAERIQRRRTKDWRMPDNTVCVDRSTPFGNPFLIERRHSMWCISSMLNPAMWFRDTKAEAADLSVKAFRHWILSSEQDGLRERAKLALRGKNLACWCPLIYPDGNRCPCHADVLLEVANG